MQKIKTAIDTLLNIGITDKLPLSEQIRVKNANRICAIAAVIATGIIPLVWDSPAAVVGVLIYVMSLCSIFIFHYFQQYTLFNLFFTLIASILNILFCSGFDQRMGVELYFIVTFVGTLFHLTAHKIRVFNAIFIAICFFIALYMQFYHIYFFKAPRLSPYIFFINLAFGFYFLSFSIIRFRRILIHAEQNTHNKNLLLAQKTAELENAHQLKDKLFSIIGHDLRAPLASINGFLEIIEMNILSEEEKKSYIQKLRNALHGSSQTLDNLIAWYLQQQRHDDIKKEIISCIEVVKMVFDTLNIIATEKQIKLSYHIPSDLQVEAEPNFLPFMLRNLIANALKFTPKGGEIIVSIEKKADKETWIFVKDTGIGIKPENLSKIFDTQVHFTTLGTNKEKGTGLGLPLCKEFANKHGSRLWVESEVGKGSIFYFSVLAVETKK